MLVCLYYCRMLLESILVRFCDTATRISVLVCLYYCRMLLESIGHPVLPMDSWWMTNHKSCSFRDGGSQRIRSMEMYTGTCSTLWMFMVCILNFQVWLHWLLLGCVPLSTCTVHERVWFTELSFLHLHQEHLKACGEKTDYTCSCIVFILFSLHEDV